MINAVNFSERGETPQNGKIWESILEVGLLPGRRLVGFGRMVGEEGNQPCSPVGRLCLKNFPLNAKL